MALFLRFAFLAAIFLSQLGWGFTYEDLKALIETNNLTRIEDVIEQLPAEFNSHYCLMHTSRSLQGASPQAPRALLFGKDAKLIIAFTGAPHLGNYAALEVMQFRQDTQQFEMRQISFPQEIGRRSTVQFSEKNPSACLSCHSTHPRPNWEKYPEWPGAYGSLDDYPTGDELAQFKDFREKVMPTGRYRFLKTREGSQATPFETKRRGRLRFRPNFQLAVLTFAYQADALKALLKRHPQYQKFQILFALGRLKCEGVKLNFEMELKQLFGENAAGPLGPWEAPVLTNIHAYILRGAGISEKKFKTALLVNEDPKADPYFFHSGIPKNLLDEKEGVIELSDLLMARMMQEMAQEISELKPYFKHARWIEKRFGDDPLDRPRATELDDLVRLYDHRTLKGACDTLSRHYSKPAAN